MTVWWWDMMKRKHQRKCLGRMKQALPQLLILKVLILLFIHQKKTWHMLIKHSSVCLEKSRQKPERLFFSQWKENLLFTVSWSLKHALSTLSQQLLYNCCTSAQSFCPPRDALGVCLLPKLSASNQKEQQTNPNHHLFSRVEWYWLQ